MKARTNGKTTMAGLAGAALAAMLATAAVAQQEEHPKIVGPSRDFVTYGAFAKLESNISEALANVLLYGRAPAKVRETIMKDFEDDLESIAIYSKQLDEQKLTGAEATALARFRKDWATFEKNAKAVMKKGGEASFDELKSVYDAANEMDDAVDEALETLRTRLAKASGS